MRRRPLPHGILLKVLHHVLAHENEASFSSRADKRERTGAHDSAGIGFDRALERREVRLGQILQVHTRPITNARKRMYAHAHSSSSADRL